MLCLNKPPLFIKQYTHKGGRPQYSGEQGVAEPPQVFWGPVVVAAAPQREGVTCEAHHGVYYVQELELMINKHKLITVKIYT